MNKKFIIRGEKEPFLWAFLRVISGAGKSLGSSDDDKIAEEHEETVFLLNTSGDTSAQINKWVWRKLRLNDKKIGKESAGLPVIVLGTGKKFLDTPEGKVFRDFPVHHKYFPKPLNLYEFLTGLSTIYPVKTHSLCVINGDAPDNLAGALEHDLSNILEKFNFEGSIEELKERFQKIEIDLDNYKKFTKNRKTLAKLTKKVKILKDEILKKRGNIWQ